MLYTKRKSGVEMAEMALGGITIYADDLEQIRSSVEAVMHGIDASLETHLCMTKLGFKKEICKTINSENPDRVFSGVFGRMLSEGRIQIAECLSDNGHVYRSFFRTADRSKLETLLTTTLSEIAKSKTCQMAAVEKRLFGGRSWGTWSKTAIIVGILARPGIVRFISRYEVAITSGAKHAANVMQLDQLNYLGGILAADSSVPG